MEVLQCPICGGKIELIEDKNIGVCPYCTYTVAFPAARDKNLKMHNNANGFRQNGEFDRAKNIYENLLMEDEKDADAYWGLVLCKYGIEYVDDPKTGKKIPTCHRASDRPIRDDADFNQAVQYADVQKKELWTKEAEKLDQILSDIMAESAKQNDFDIFICYKESDINGKRTEDSVLAYEIYDMLTARGYKVFFAPKSIGLGQTYEPVIFAALRSAKLMFVIGTKIEYLEAPWVKNEWSRYMEQIYNGREKTLIVLYKGLNPADFPAELKRRQGYDLNTMGYLQDISEAAGKIIGRREKTPEVRNTDSSACREALRYVRQGDEKLGENDWITAREYYDEALSLDATCAQAWWGKLKAQTHNLEVGPWEPVYTPEILEYRARALQYADYQEAAAYRKILGEYEKAVSNLVVPKYQEQLDHLYEEEKKNLADSKYVFNLDEQKLQSKMEEYSSVYRKIEDNSYKDIGIEVRKQHSQLEKYRSVFNGLLLKYLKPSNKSDPLFDKKRELANKREVCLEKRWIVTGGRSGYISGIVAIATAIFFTAISMMGFLNIRGLLIFTLLIEFACIGVDISVNHMSNCGTVSKVLMFFIGPLLLFFVNLLVMELLTVQFGLEIEMDMQVLLSCYIIPALVMAVDLFFNKKKCQKEQTEVKNLEEAEQNYMHVKDEMIDQVNKMLDQAEQECDMVKKYFLNREIIYKVIDYYF